MASDETGRSEAKHPIRVVAKRTGIGTHALRAWERRYGVVEPVRTEGGQRLYSDADIERLLLLRDAVASGRSISHVAELSDMELASLIAQDRAAGFSAPPEPEPDSATEVEIGRYLEECLSAAQRLDDQVLHRLLMRALVALRPMDFIEGLIGPLLFEVGERWHAGALRPAQEHAVSVSVRRVLTFLLAAYEPKPDAPTLIVTTVAGDPHEFGAMLAAVLAAEAGWRVVYLGPSLPADEIARAAQISGADAVAVSAVDDRGASELVGELERLRAQLPRHIRLVAGGRVLERHAAAMERIPGVELSDLRGLRASFELNGAEGRS
jgi:MerR family transcriptional regulator, light-induced transcriptional regulator